MTETTHDALARPRPENAQDAAAWDHAATVSDPEIPVLTIEDLGILREVRVAGTAVEVAITPTYSGCPAMDVIREDVTAVLTEAGYTSVSVRQVLAPAWTTDWISQNGRDKLREYGIAPPTGARQAGPVPLSLSVQCPQCRSLRTREVSRFGSTACKALFACLDCLEPFDYFKELR